MPGRKQKDGAPIFIVGISPRSGTNYLFDLIKLHPAVGASRQIAEDFLAYYADDLEHYARSVYWRWRQMRHVDAENFPTSIEGDVMAALGNGLLGFMRERCPAERIVTKTPAPRNLDRLLRLFPSAHLLIIVRDGRSVVESSMRTFRDLPERRSYESYMRQWVTGARTILDFTAAFADQQHRFRLIRYEDLFADEVAETRALLDFCQLDPGRYDFASVASLPVRGSSTHGRGAVEGDSGEGNLAPVDWKPRERTADFDPLERWRDWPDSRHATFNRLAAEYMQAFGYEIVETAG